MTLTKKVLASMTLLFAAGGANFAFAQGQLPTGEAIARAARGARLNPGASATAEKDGMKATITPVDLSKIKTPKDLEKGQVIAVADVKGIPDMPDGKYNVFLVKLNDGWQEFFESGGKIVKHVKRIQVSLTTTGERRKSIQAAILLEKNCFCGSGYYSGNGWVLSANCNPCD